VNFRACIDTTEVGALDKCVVMGPYRKTRDFAPLTKSDQLHYSVNFHDKGNTLEIVSMCCKFLDFNFSFPYLCKNYFLNKLHKNISRPWDIFNVF